MAICNAPDHDENRYKLTDARGIFCGYVCPKCEDAKRATFREDIFTNSSYDADEYIEDEY